MATLTHTPSNLFPSHSDHLEDPRFQNPGIAGRLVQVLIAIHLLPALAVVLVVGSIGMALLGAARLMRGEDHNLVL